MSALLRRVNRMQIATPPFCGFTPIGLGRRVYTIKGNSTRLRTRRQRTVENRGQFSVDDGNPGFVALELVLS